MAAVDTPKHLEVYTQLRDDIDAGEFGPGRRIPPESQLCQRFNVSRPTIARAIGILEQQGRLVRRRGAGTFVAATANRSQQFGLLVPDLRAGGIFAPLCAAVTESAAAAGHTVIFAANSTDDIDIDSCAQRLIDAEVSGVFFSPLELPTSPANANAQIIKRFADAQIPVVLLDRDICPYPQRSHLDLVGIDNFHAGMMVTEHALSLGCQRIDVVTTETRTNVVHSRIDGYYAALLRAGITPDPNRVHWEHVRGDPSFLEALLQDLDTDVLVCINDHMARDFMLRATMRGIRIPEDLRIISFDDLPFAATLPVPLTSLHQPLDAIGVAAVELLLQRIENSERPARDVNIRSELVVRKSCGATLT